MALLCRLHLLFVLFYTVIASADTGPPGPLILLISSQPKCMSVEAPADTVLNVQYEAPDFMDSEKGEPVDNHKRKQKGQQSYKTTITIKCEGDAATRNRNRRKRNKIAEAHRKNRNRKDGDDDIEGEVTHELVSKKGSVEMTTIADGKVSICVQALLASSVNPFPISLKVTESSGETESVGRGKESKSAEEKELDSQSQRNAKEHFSQMEKTLSALISKTDTVLRQADFAKELEVEFHEQSIAMNRASQWWPIVQLCVLLVTGFTQANHMVQFFRKHHIF